MKHGCKRLLRGLITLVFAGAGVLKAGDATEFAFAIDRYHLVPWPVAVALALYLPWLEMAAAAALWSARTRAAALVILTILALVFLTALTTAAWRGLDIDCGCFGSLMTTGLRWALARAALSLLAVRLLARWDRAPDSAAV